MSSKRSAVQHEQLYKNLCERVRTLRESGHEPDRVVVPGNAWRSIKDQAEVRPGEGVAGSDETLVNGVPAVYNDTLRTGRVVFKVRGEEDE